MARVVVVGAMRTGTSLVAQWLHELGLPMGEFMRFPITGYLEWEDVEFTDTMLAAVRGEIDRAEVRAFIREYAKKRGEHWGMKSPFALPFVDILRDEIPDLKVILTKRDIEGTFKSIERVGIETEKVKEIQQLLIPWIDKFQPDLVVNIEESWYSQDKVKYKLKELLMDHVNNPGGK